MFDNPFHNIAADAKNEREQLDRLLRITAPHERLALAGIGLVVAAFVVWLLFGSVVRSVTVDGVLIQPGERHAAVSAEAGQLLEYLVRSGDRVRAGQPIARQTVPDLERETTALRDRVNMLRAEIARSGGTDSALRSLLASTRVALLQMEARRSARQMIVSRIAGEVMVLSKAPGDYLDAGAAVAQIRKSGNRSLQAVLRVDRFTARRIRPGMPATVEVTLPDGTPRRLVGTAAGVTAGPLPDWLAGLKPAVPPSRHRIDIRLDGASDLILPDGTTCRIRIELGRSAPISLLDAGRS